MFVTLEVSKLSGWLNADADCREPKGGHTLPGEVRAAGGGRRRATAVHAGRREGSTADWEQHGEERTQNMPNIVVTLDVFQLERSSLKFPKP